MDRADKIIYRLGGVVIFLAAVPFAWFFLTAPYSPENRVVMRLLAGLLMLGSTVGAYFLWRWIHKREPSNQYKRRIKVFWFFLVWGLLVLQGLTLPIEAGGRNADFIGLAVPVSGLGYGVIVHFVLYWINRIQPKFFWPVSLATIATWPVVAWYIFILIASNETTLKVFILSSLGTFTDY